jgi:flagellar hook-associated protein 1 FlgK
MSTFSSIEMGKRSLFAHNQAIQTAGHNLSNSSTEGYSRQRVQMKAFEPIYPPRPFARGDPGQIGQGVTVEAISASATSLLDQRIVAQTNGKATGLTRDNYILKMEQ